MIYVHFSALCNYVFVLLDARRRSPNLPKKILNNVAHQKENSFESKEKSSKLKALKEDAVELPLSAHYYYYRLSVFVFEPFWTAGRAGYLFGPKAVFFSFRLRLN